MKLRPNFLLLIIIIWVWATCLSAQFRAGSGTENDPYLISSQTELNNIRHYSDAYFLQTGDIYLENDWHPIELFSGFYNGNGYTIYNLNIKTNQDNTGLFSVLSGGQISSLRLEGGSVTGRDNVGALVGSNEGGIIYRCSANLTVSGSNDVGGLIGSNFGVIEESFLHSSSITGSKNTGGLVGANYGGQIINCYSTNSVSGITSTGGLTGLNIIGGKLLNSFASGKVSGETDTGGFAGKNLYADIQNSFWDIESSGQETSAGGTGLTTVRMMQQASFTNWDFDGQEEIWAIEEWHTEPFSTYPYLQWQTEGQDPVGIEHNKPKNEELKPISGSGLHWVSFPWLSRDQLLEDPPEREQTAEEALRPVNNDNIGYIDVVTYWDASADPLGFKLMEWDNGIWTVNDIGEFSSTQGFIIDVNHQAPFDIPFYGTIEDPETEFSIYVVDEEYENEGNWIGYFLPDDQYAFDAFGDRIDDFKMIKTQHVGMHWDENTEEWYFDNLVTPEGPLITYGSMVKVTLRDNQDIHDFSWNLQRGRSSERRSFPRPKPQHFEISYGTDYESIFIADIADDEDVVEIGIYVDGECIGASVVTGDYLLEILAYTNHTHLNETMTFVLYLDDDSYERYDKVLVKDLSSRNYSRRVLTPRENLFTIVKLDRTGGERSLTVEEEAEDILPPAFVLSQNYPNPFSLRAGVRGQGLTSISLSLPQDMPVSLNVYNIKGQLVRTLMSGEVNRGKHTVGWNGKDNNNNMVSSGIYFYRLETPDKTITRKMLIVR